MLTVKSLILSGLWGLLGSLGFVAFRIKKRVLCVRVGYCIRVMRVIRAVLGLLELLCVWPKSTPDNPTHLVPCSNRGRSWSSGVVERADIPNKYGEREKRESTRRSFLLWCSHYTLHASTFPSRGATQTLRQFPTTLSATGHSSNQSQSREQQSKEVTSQCLRRVITSTGCLVFKQQWFMLVSSLRPSF